MKEIWKAFWDAVVVASEETWVKIKNFIASTWALVKEPLLTLLEKVYDWVISLLSGVGVIVWDWFTVVAKDFSVAIGKTVKLVFVKIADLIKKLFD